MGVQVYEGSCHCGAVRFSAQTALDSLMRCNCSRCKRLGWVLQPVPSERFTLSIGADTLTSYRFNTERINHTFCSVCGVEAFANGTDRDGNPLYMVNVNCLDGAQYDAETVTNVDGASF